MGDEIAKLKEEIEKVHSQFYIFYELTNAMRRTLRLDEIVYIILTGLTAHKGLAFNRAMLFLVDDTCQNIKGFMGIGPMGHSEADAIWRHIKEEKKELNDLIDNYNRIKEGKIKPKFMEFIQSLSFPLTKGNGFITDALFEMGTLHVREDKINQLKNDPLINQLELNEFLISSLWIKDKPSGIIIVDNYITEKLITEEDIRIFNMFVTQATSAIENSQAFEDTLIKAHTDSLTELWNYGHFQYKLDEELIKAKAKNLNLSIMMIDIDDFKHFNDTYGHIQGDNALKRISSILKENCRKANILCRYGGEEFSLILPSTNKTETLQIAERSRISVQEHGGITGYKLTISIGLASFPEDTSEKNDLIEKADQALYQAKREGKNRTVIAGSSSQQINPLA